MTSQTRRYIERAIADTGVVELRHQGDRWTTGWFNHPDPLLKHAWNLKDSGNLFISLNRPSPRIVTNDMTGDPIRNDDIQFITRLFFDFDPVRPKGQSSTKDELQFAKWAAQECLKMQRAMGWPDPLVAVSGNGVHLLYRCHLPNTSEIRDQLSTMYTGMRADYTMDTVDFDRAVRNPGRICALYGTTKRKGENTPDRPHRVSEITKWPRDWKQVPRRNFNALAEFYAIRQQAVAGACTHKPTDQLIRPTGDGDYATLDIVAWFRAHGLYRRSFGTYNGTPRHTVRCPFEGEHSNESGDGDTSTVIFENATGWPGFHCSHDHCDGRSVVDVMQVMGDADAFCARAWERQS